MSKKLSGRRFDRLACVTEYDLPLTDCTGLEPGDFVKLTFCPADDHMRERMWVIVSTVAADHFTGILDNQPANIEGLEPGDTITFRRHNVMHRMTTEEMEALHARMIAQTN